VTGTIEEHDVRGAVERMAAAATTPALPGTAIMAAGARRRTRRRAGAVGALALAATLAVSVTATTFGSSGGSTSATSDTAPTTTNAFTEQLGRTLEQVLPGTSITARMFTDQNPVTRHSREDRFVLQIKTPKGTTDGFLLLRADQNGDGPDFKAAALCAQTLPWHSTRSGCVTKDLADGGVLHAEIIQGPGSWDSRTASVGTDSSTTLTLVEGEVYHSRTSALLQVRGGTNSNKSGISPAMLSAGLEDPRFTAYLADFAAHPESDPYGPLAPIDKTVVATGSVGTHQWTLSFAKIAEDWPGITTKATDNCDYWEYDVDGKPAKALPGVYCSLNGSVVANPPPTAGSHADPGYLIQSSTSDGSPAQVFGTALSSTVLPGTVSVEATFDDDSAKLTGKVFTVKDGTQYFALLKTDPAKPTWKLATVRCLDASGKELGKLYFMAPNSQPPKR
jgi:hypothetical protein